MWQILQLLFLNSYFFSQIAQIALHSVQLPLLTEAF